MVLKNYCIILNNLANKLSNFYSVNAKYMVLNNNKYKINKVSNKT